MDSSENKQIYTVYLREGLSDSKWVKSLQFFKGRTFLTAADWQVCDVPSKRKKSLYLGEITNPVFPIEFPLVLDNNIQIQDPTCNFIYNITQIP